MSQKYLRQATNEEQLQERKKLETFFGQNNIKFEFDPTTDKYIVWVSKVVRSEEQPV